MRSATYHLSADTVRADALFASDLQRCDEPSVAQVDQAIAAAVRALGARGCAARVRSAGVRARSTAPMAGVGASAST